MRRDYQRTPRGRSPVEQCRHHGLTRCAVQLAGRLIGKEKARCADDGARKPDPLRLPAGQFLRQLRGEFGQIEHGQRRHRPVACRRRAIREQQRQFDVFEHAQRLNQSRRLEAHGHLGRPQIIEAAEGRPFDRPARRTIKSRHQVEQGRLAAARRAHDCDASLRIDPARRWPQRVEPRAALQVNARRVPDVHEWGCGGGVTHRRSVHLGYERRGQPGARGRGCV